MDLYAENILEHSRHPRGKKILANASVEHKEVNTSCGDSLSIALLIKDGVIKDFGWEGEGCAISQAGMSLLGEELVGMTETQLMELSPQEIRELLGVPISARRSKCAYLCLHALKNALHTLHKKPLQEWRETLGEASN